MTISTEEWQLLSFFEVEPQLLDANVPWCYNDATYEVLRDDLSLSVFIKPSYHDVRIELRHQGHLVYELKSREVKDVSYEELVGMELLTIRINDSEWMTLRLKPHIEIRHSANWPLGLA